MATALRLLPLALALLTSGDVVAQTIFWEVEPNDTKPLATRVPGMASGDQIVSTCSGEVDLFRIRTAPAAPGLRVHRLTSWKLLGRSQSSGAVDPLSSVALQQDPQLPGQALQWYGFGQGEEVFVENWISFSCRYVDYATLVSAPVTPAAVPVTLTPGTALQVTPTASSSTTDLDLVIADADLDAVPGSGVRVDVATGLPVARCDLTEGTYYLGVSHGPLVHAEPAAPFDAAQDDPVLDLRGAFCSTSSVVGAGFELDVGGHVVQGTFTRPREIVWFELTVGAGQNVATFCPADGSGGACPGRASPPGHGAGCANSTERGGRLVAYGTLRPGDVRYELLDLPPSSTALVFAGLTTALASPSHGGLVCVGAGAIRVGTTSTDSLGRGRVVSSEPAFVAAGFLAGTTVYAQAAYRDPAAPAGQQVNITNGEAVTIRP